MAECLKFGKNVSRRKSNERIGLAISFLISILMVWGSFYIKQTGELKRGRKLAEQYCLWCHGFQNTPPTSGRQNDFFIDTSKISDATIKQKIEDNFFLEEQRKPTEEEKRLLLFWLRRQDKMSSKIATASKK